MGRRSSKWWGGLGAALAAAVVVGASQVASAAPDEPPAPEPVAARPHVYTLAECLALVDRNHPNIWAARARLAFVHGQLDEAKTLPFWQWSAEAKFGVLPYLGGTPLYSDAPRDLVSRTQFDNVQPFFRFDINGVVPLYTFGKITAARESAEAQVRVFEWDMEKVRQQARWDVRRAYFGLLLARDARYLISEITDHIDKGLRGVRNKLAKGDPNVAEWDKLRLEVYREQIRLRMAEADKGETMALSALRFLTGVQTGFDIPDQPLKRPDKPVGAVVQYLQAARLFRPEVNMARAGIVARKHWLDYQRARFFPDLGLGLGATYAIAPSAVIQNIAWVGDPFNVFGAWFGLGARWNLDLMPQAARAAQAEAQLEETRAQERYALGGLSVEVETAYATLMEAKVREESWDRAEHKAKQWISTVQDAIDLGTLDERALLEPLRTYADSRGQHLFALMDFNVQMSFLAMVSGWDTAAPSGG